MKKNRSYGSEIALAAKESGFAYETIRRRVRSGMTIEEAMSVPRTREKWPQEWNDFLLAHYKGRGHQELADLINSELGTNLTKDKIKGFLSRNKLDSGRTGYFQKGQESFNKGKKWDDFMSKESQARSRKTTFKKGNRPHNHLPVGTEIVDNKDGYLYRKIADPNKWEPVHIIIWEDFHKKEKPKGHVVIFLDGDKGNINIDNLALIKRSEHVRMNQNNLRFEDPDLTRSGIAITKLRLAIIDKSKKGDKNGNEKQAN